VNRAGNEKAAEPTRAEEPFKKKKICNNHEYSGFNKF
jgi:hypothetical protein